MSKQKRTRRSTAMLLAIIVFGRVESAEIDNHQSLFFDGYTYRYEKVAVYENNSKDVAYYTGIISVVDDGLGINYLHRTDHAPGCNGFPAISLIDINTRVSPMSQNFRRNEYVVFCGNTNGPHNTIRIFKPGFGVVATLDFMYGPVELNKDSDGGYIAVVTHEIFLTTLGMKIPYIVVYRLKSGAWPMLSFSAHVDSFVESRYQSHASLSYETFIRNPDRFVASGFSGVISSLIMRDENMLQRIRRHIDLEGKVNTDLVIKEIQKKLNLKITMED